jgi:hypothetical protein
MANMTRQPGKTWYPPNEWQYVQLQVLMDIRDELLRLNNVMQCRNVARGFQALAKIARRDEKAFKRRVEHAVAKRVKRATT